MAAKDGTDKCLAARKIPGCILVKASWLVECYWSMTRRDPNPHLLSGNQVSVETLVSEHIANTENQMRDMDESDGSDGSDDDDLVAAFASEIAES